MSIDKGVYSPSFDDDDSDLSLEPMGLESIAAMKEGRSLLERGEEDSLKEVGPASMAALTEQDSLDLVEMGPTSMAAFAAARPTVAGKSKEVNGELKEGSVPVPQPKPRRKPQAQEDKNLTDLYAENARLRGQKVELEQQLDRAKREGDDRAKQQEKMIGRLTAQLEVQSEQYRSLIHHIEFIYLLTFDARGSQLLAYIPSQAHEARASVYICHGDDDHEFDHQD